MTQIYQNTTYNKSKCKANKLQKINWDTSTGMPLYKDCVLMCNNARTAPMPVPDRGFFYLSNENRRRASLS